MAARVSLRSIVDAMYSQSEMARSYLNRVTGELIYIGYDELLAAETGEHESLCDPDVLELAKKMLAEEDNYVLLPDQYMINEYQIMERFAMSLPNPVLSDKVLSVMRGRGAFHRFKDIIANLRLEQDWYDYLEREFKEIAIDWCEEHNIEYKDE